MKTILDPQIGTTSNRLEESDVIGIVVSDEDAAKIKDGSYWDKFDKPLIDYKVGDDFGGEPLDQEGLDIIHLHRKAFKDRNLEIEASSDSTLCEGLKAPEEWHQNNFILGADAPSYKEIKGVKFVENRDTEEIEKVKTSMGYRGAVASGKRQEDGSIKWDWNYEDEDSVPGKLLDFHVLPDMRTDPEYFYNSRNYVPSYQHLDPMPKDEEDNPLMAWKEVKEPTLEEWKDLTQKAVDRMIEAEESEEFIQNFINERQSKTTDV